MQLYEKPWSRQQVGARAKGLSKDTMEFVPELASWFTTSTAQPRYDIYRRGPQNALNKVTQFVQERESFAGRGGVLYAARARVLDVKDPVARAAGLEFLDKLKQLPLENQQRVLAFLNGRVGGNQGIASAPDMSTMTSDQIDQYMATGANPTVAGPTGTLESDIESLGLGDQLNVNYGGPTGYSLGIVDNPRGGDTGLAAESLYIALAKAFPELNLDLEDQHANLLDQTAMDVSDFFIEPALESKSLNDLADVLAPVYAGNPEDSYWDTFKHVVLSGSSAMSEYFWGAAGAAGRKIGAEGLVDDVSSAWGNVEQVMSDTLVGYYDPAIEGYVPGLLNWDVPERVAAEHPDWSQAQIDAESDSITAGRSEAFGLISIFAGGALGVAAGPMGRRVKIIRSIIGETPAAIRAGLPTTFKPKVEAPGLLDRAAEVYRAPGRRIGEAFDNVAIAHLAVSPDDFFKEAMFGRLYNTGGKKLLKALSAAKKAFPGDSPEARDAQVGFIKARYGDQLKGTDLVRNMLDAPTPEAAKVAFIDYATRPQGEVAYADAVRALEKRQAALAKETADLADGEEAVQWNKDLDRYDELTAQNYDREAILSDEDPKKGWADRPAQEQAEVQKALEEEAELANLRKRLGFTPTAENRFGVGWEPSRVPPVPPEPRFTSVKTNSVEELLKEIQRLKDSRFSPDARPGDGDAINVQIAELEKRLTVILAQVKKGDVPEGTVVMMPTSELGALADPDLWDPNTQQARPMVKAVHEPGYIVTSTADASPEAQANVSIDLYQTIHAIEQSGYDYNYAIVPKDKLEEIIARGNVDIGELDWVDGSYVEDWVTSLGGPDEPLAVVRHKILDDESNFGEDFDTGTYYNTKNIPLTGFDVLDNTANWAPGKLQSNLIAAPDPELGISTAAVAAASLSKADAVRKFSGFENYPSLDESYDIDTHIQELIQMIAGSSQSMREAARNIFDDSKRKIGDNTWTASLIVRTEDGVVIHSERWFWAENPDTGKTTAVMFFPDSTPMRGPEPRKAFPDPTEFDLHDMNHIALKSRRGTTGGSEMLRDLVNYYNPTPDQLLEILKGNFLSRKGALATWLLLRKRVKDSGEMVGKLTRARYDALKADIQANGIQEPLEVTVNPNTGEAIASEGFHRWLIARELGIEEVPVKIDYDATVQGPQFMKVGRRPTPSSAQLQKLARKRLAVQAAENDLAHTSPDMPQLYYPRLSHVRAAVRAPVSKGEKMIATIFGGKFSPLRMGPNQLLDLAKFVDELPSRPTMYVPGDSKNPADWVDRNQHTIQNYLRRAGVPDGEAGQAIAKLSRQRTPQEFYEVLEKEIFGDGGLIDNNLRPDIKADKELRASIIYLHGRTVESRTKSVIRNFVDVGGGTTAADAPVLAVQKGRQLIPLPSRPTEVLKEVSLPDVDRLIEATSTVRRVVRNMEKAGVGKVNAAAPWSIAKLAMRMQTAVLKPAVMLVRLPAMAMRIQLEQSLRMQSFGYRPFKGIPEGWTLFPGGIPVPFSKDLSGIAGLPIPQNVRVLSGLFGEDGWKMTAPDPRVHGTSQLPVNSELGGMLEENTDNGPTDTYAIGTAELREDAGRITTMHTEGYRSEIEQAHVDWLSRKIVGTGFDRAKVKAWLLSRRKGREFMQKTMIPNLKRSTLYPQLGNPDGMVINLPASEVAKYVEFPNRLEGSGRTPEQLSELEKSLANGYDPNFVPEGTLSGEPVGHIIMEYDTKTGMAVVREAHHRIGILAKNGKNVDVQIKVVNETPAVSGVNIAEVEPSTALSELSALNTNATQVGAPLDLTRYVDTDEARLDTAINAWLDQQITYLKQITSENPNVVDYIKTGKLRTNSVGDGGMQTFDNAGGHIIQRYRELKSDIDNIKADLERRYQAGDMLKPETRDEYVALQVTLHKRERKMADLMDEYPDELNVRYVSSKDHKGFREEVKRMWTDNPDTIPDRLMVQYGNFQRNPNLGFKEDMHRWADAASSAMYRPFNGLSWVDRHGTRGSLWEQAYNQKIDVYLRRGYTLKQARSIAFADAGNITRDLMYDLNARTSVQRALKDIFWFAPATQEVMYTWLIKVPSQSYWPLGIVNLYTKAKIGMWALKELGIVEEDAQGEAIVKVPGFSHIVEMMTGKKVPPIVFGKLSGLNLVTTGGGVPGLSTLGNFTLGRAALRWGGLAKEMSDVFQPYGPEASLLPAPITYLHEAVFGEAPPFEPLSHDYTKAQWDRAFDQSIQYAYHDLAEDGVVPPRVEDFGHDEDGRIVLSAEEENAYRAARDDYLNELMTESKSYAQGYAWTRFMGSTVMPMSLYTTSKEREEWLKFWEDLTGDRDIAGGLNNAEQETITQYLSDHPNSLAFSVFTTKYGKKTRDLPFAESNDDAYFDAYYTGEASTLTPEEFSQKLMMTESRRFYQATLDKALRDISPDMDPWELLRNYGMRGSAITRYNEQWDRYLFLNPDAADLVEQQSRFWAESNNIPKRSFEAERLSQTLDMLKQVTPMLTGEEDIRPEELRAVQGQIAALYGETGTFPEPSTPSAKAIGWWMNEVLDPYMEKTADLYDQAEELQSHGLDASGVYNQIRVLANTPPPKYRGVTVPGVEEFFWGNKTQAERDATKLTWASRPISWLSDFQRKTVGYNVTKDGSEFLDQMAWWDDQFYADLKAKDISSGSNEYDKWMNWRDQELNDLADKYGAEGHRLLDLTEAPPITRIAAADYGKGQAWKDAVAGAQYTLTSIEDKGFSAKGYSETAMSWKLWFYGELETQMSLNPALRTQLDQLKYSFPMDGGGYRQGVVLYEALFFGNFNEDFIPDELIQGA